MSQSPIPSRGRPGRVLAALLPLVLGALAAVSTPTTASAAVGDTQIAWLEVEDGAISGGPALNSGDHGNFSGTGSYTFRDPGMRSTMTFNAPEAGTYPVWIRYSAGGLGGADDSVTRKMGLLVNDGARQLLDFPPTFVPGEADQHDGWERWSWTRADVALNAGTNTLAVDCQRNADSGGTETCRLNFDAIQVGGTAPTGGTMAAPCAPSTTVPAGATRLFDGTFASLDGTIAAPRWHKAGAGGFGFQADCTLRGFRGQGTTWTLAQQSGPYTLGVDFMRGASTSASTVYFASTSNASSAPAGGYGVKIGASDTGTIISGDGTVNLPADPTALAAALRPQGQWNSFAIQVTPARVVVLLNGMKVNVVDRTAAMAGYVGLENRAGDDAVSNVKFRNIYVDSKVVLGQMSAPARRATKADGTTPNPGGESTLGNLVAEAQRWATRGSSGGTARIAFASPSALKGDLVPDGASLTYAQAAAVLDAEPLVNMRLTGAQIKTVLEQQWQLTAGGQVPSPAFLRLGASSGLTWTHDSSRPQGDRITGTWLDGAPLNPSGNYSVTVSQSLANGGDNFRAFTNGLVPQVRQATTLSALAAYVGDASTTGPLAVPQSQRAVGVSVPGGAPSSYVAGTTYAVDLSSWSYSTPTDPQDTTVDVTIGGVPAGSFPVDATRTDNPFDEDGRVAVRATIPATLASGAATVRMVGTTTGTAVTRSIAVTAAPPVPTPTPTPVPTPTPTPTPTPPPAVTKAKPTLKVKIKPVRVIARETKAKLVVTVASTGATPTGKVTVRVAGKTYVAKLRRGKAVVTLKAFAKAGKARTKVSYSGDAATLSAARTVKIAVLAP